MHFDIFRQSMERHIRFTDEEFRQFSSYFKRVKVAKKEFLLKEGQICRFEGFVTGGCFRTFVLNEDGFEKVLYFSSQGWWVTDLDSFTNSKPATQWIQAMEDSELLLISKEDKERLFAEMHKVEKLFRIISQKALIALNQRIWRNHSLTAKERYLHFTETYPEVAKKLTNVQLASYLGITHEFVSKIRKTIAGNRE